MIVTVLYGDEVRRLVLVLAVCGVPLESKRERWIARGREWVRWVREDVVGSVINSKFTETELWVVGAGTIIILVGLEVLQDSWRVMMGRFGGKLIVFAGLYLRYPIVFNDDPHGSRLVNGEDDQVRFRASVFLASLSAAISGLFSPGPYNMYLCVIHLCICFLVSNSFLYRVVGSRVTSARNLSLLQIVSFTIFGNVKDVAFSCGLTRLAICPCRAEEPIRIFLLDGVVIVLFYEGIDRKAGMVMTCLFIMTYCVITFRMGLVYTEERWLEKQRDAQNFLDHALKQKLAGMAITLEHVLSDDQAVMRNLSADTYRVLFSAWKESLFASYMCYQTILKQKTVDGRYAPHYVARSLLSVTKEWQDTWRDIDLHIVYVANDVKSIDVKLFKAICDWNIVFSIMEGILRLIDKTHGESKFPIIVRVSYSFEKSMTMVIFEISSPHHHQPLTFVYKPTIRYFAEDILQGSFDFVNDLRCVRLQIPIQSSGKENSGFGDEEGEYEYDPAFFKSRVANLNWAQPSQPHLEQKFFHEPSFLPPVDDGLHFEDEIIAANLVTEELPANLVFALLDDSAIVRANMKLAFVKDFRASEKSVVYGASQKDCLEFCERCCTLNPDVCILDENLDYSDQIDGSLILGSDIAKELRRAGFRNVIVMHSANDLLRDKINTDVVNGFILKGTNRQKIKRDIVKILNNSKFGA